VGSPLVTVVVLAHNRAGEVRFTLRALRDRLEYPADRLETIVVDNASSDGTAAMVRAEFPGVQVVRNERNVGISGWNEGLARGRGDFFLLLDDDCYLAGDSLARAVAAARDDGADLVSFLVRAEDDPDFTFNGIYDPGLLAFWGCAALLGRRAVEALGGFDPAIFVWAHEAEFTMRLLDRGLRHLHLPEISAYHLAAPERARSRDAAFHRLNTHNLAYTAAKLLRPRDAATALVNLTATALLSAAAHPDRVGSVLAVAQGGWRGSRRRAAVRASVSALYRTNFVEFVSPFRFVRGVHEADFVRRRRRFRDARPELYPTSAAWLQL
jgi:GT2 family glycosyltransferase